MPVQLKYSCSHCKTKLLREVTWIDPKNFAKKAQMKSVFWCTGCGESIALVLEFGPKGGVSIVKEESTLGLYKPEDNGISISARPRNKARS